MEWDAGTPLSWELNSQTKVRCGTFRLSSKEPLDKSKEPLDNGPPLPLYSTRPLKNGRSTNCFLGVRVGYGLLIVWVTKGAPLHVGLWDCGLWVTDDRLPVMGYE